MEEFELTYLAKELPADLRDYPSKEVIDIYVPASTEHPVLRIRKFGSVHEITKKQPIKGGDSSHQLETTIPLTPEEFSTLSQVKGKKVSKTRYYYQRANTVFEFDIFRDALLGLVLVDVEFKSQEEKSVFVMPEFCLADVTQEKLTAGGMLCGKSYGDIEKDLEKFGYQKITADF